MLKFKIFALLASIHLLMFECFCFEIQQDPENTEQMVAEFLLKRNASWIFSTRRIESRRIFRLFSRRDHICRRPRHFLAYLCAVILKHNPYNEVIDSERYQVSNCGVRSVSSKLGIIGQKKIDQIRLYECPINFGSDFSKRYYISRTSDKSTLFVYVSNDEGFHIYPDAIVSEINMSKMIKDYAKSKILKKKRHSKVKQFESTSPSKSKSLRLHFNDGIIVIFSHSALEKAEQFQYLNFQNQNLPYKKFQVQYNKINVCSLSWYQQTYLCQQLLDSPHYTSEIDRKYYRKNNCRKRQISNETWHIDNPISTLMCPPTFSHKKIGHEKSYNKESYFLSSGPDVTSLVIFERSYNEHKIKPIDLISQINTNKLDEILRIERSEPWTDLTTSENDTESQFSASSRFSGGHSRTSSFFSLSSSDRGSPQSSFYSSSSDRGSSDSLYSLSPSDTSPPRKPISGSISTTALSINKNSEPVVKDINHDRYVAEEETVAYSRFKSIKNPYERFQLTYTTTNICSFTAKLRVQLCREILESPQFGYHLVTTIPDDISCQQKDIAVNLQDSEDLFSNQMSLLQCPSIQAFHSVYFLSSSQQNRSAILFRRLGVTELIYPEAFITYDNRDVVQEQKTLHKMFSRTSSLSYITNSFRK